MNKSVNLYFNNNVDTKSKLDEIKKVGYDEFFTGCYDKNETMTMEEQIEYAKELNLKCSMIHCSYIEPELDNFWLDNDVGEKVLNSYLIQIERCAGLTKNFVVHLNGSYNSIVSDIGLERIRSLLKQCELYDMNLCIENLYSDVEIPYIFQNINHKNLKICFDTGHRNFLTPNFDVLENYAQCVSVFHIHDNDGYKDLHKVCFTGTIDWEAFANSVQKVPNIVLCSEIKYKDEDFKKLLQLNYDCLCRLENLIIDKSKDC